VSAGAPRPALVGLSLADPPERWAALGFAVSEDGWMVLGGVVVGLGTPGTGITAWSVDGIDAPGGDVDGLVLEPASPPPERAPAHPNVARGLDHVVAMTPDFDRTAAALADAGMPLRRVRDTGRLRQGFRRLGPAILELVEARDAPPGPARFWGLVVIVDDLAALGERLGEDVGAVRPAVQPGRRIATLGRRAGLSVAVAFMDPEPPPA
jgi:hypothetical protein